MDENLINSSLVWSRLLKNQQQNTTERSSTVNISWPLSPQANAKRKPRETGAFPRPFLTKILNQTQGFWNQSSHPDTFSRPTRRSQEISLVIKQTFEAAIMTHLLPRTEINIYLQVLQADGGMYHPGALQTIRASPFWRFKSFQELAVPPLMRQLWLWLMLVFLWRILSLPAPPAVSTTHLLSVRTASDLSQLLNPTFLIVKLSNRFELLGRFIWNRRCSRRHLAQNQQSSHASNGLKAACADVWARFRSCNDWMSKNLRDRRGSRSRTNESPRWISWSLLTILELID